jgi:hypothetical protein
MTKEHQSYTDLQLISLSNESRANVAENAVIPAVIARSSRKAPAAAETNFCMHRPRAHACILLCSRAVMDVPSYAFHTKKFVTRDKKKLGNISSKFHLPLSNDFVFNLPS